MTLWDQAPNLLGAPLNSAANGVFIIGNGGLVIPGYTDDATLQQNYPQVTDPNERYTIGVNLSKNRLILAVAPDTDLQDASQPLAVTYIVGTSSGVGNIVPHDIEYLNAGTMSFTYDEDTDE
jgi:hypothetical protein